MITKQELLFRGKFGDKYTECNQGDVFLANNIDCGFFYYRRDLQSNYMHWWVMCK